MTNLAGTQASSADAGRLTRYLWLLWIVWLSFLTYPLSALFRASPSRLRLVVVLIGAVLFVGVYVWNIWHSFRRVTTGRPAQPSWLSLAVLIVLALALTLGDRRDWIELFIFVGVSMGPSLPGKQAVIGVSSIVAVMVVLGLALHAGAGPTAQIALQGAASGFAAIIVVRTISMERELRLARVEIVRLAVSEERLRFARDLHDLLGHSLSLITLKSELASRLATMAPDKAASEMLDVEQVARTALREVREAVAGYRQSTLASELDGAREMLAAAGILHQIEGEMTPLPAATEAVLSWAVREGVTNVIRHSRGHRCTIRLTADATQAGVELIDDGQGTPDERSSGSGLVGLAERAAAMGGWCKAGAQPGEGFRLAVAVPLGTGGVAPPERSRDQAGARQA